MLLIVLHELMCSVHAYCTCTCMYSVHVRKICFYIHVNVHIEYTCNTLCLCIISSATTSTCFYTSTMYQSLVFRSPINTGEAPLHSVPVPVSSDAVHGGEEGQVLLVLLFTAGGHSQPCLL